MEKNFNQNFTDVFEASKKALRNLKMEIGYTDISKGIVEAATGTSLLSWGEDIQLRVNRKAYKTCVKVKSTSKSQFISWGKNESNEKNIIAEITKIIGR